MISYNIWYDDNSGLSHRYQQITDFIARENPGYLCLQEVTPRALQILKTRFSGRYQIHDEGIANKRYGNVVLSRSTNSRAHTLRLKSSMQRNALIVEDGNYTLVNLHLESLLTDTKVREQQLIQIIGHTLHSKNLILCGDFNFGDREAENLLLRGFSDAGRKQALATYDIENNALARKTRFYNESSRRLDKILTRVTAKQFTLKRLALTFSDHYPVVLTITND